MEKDLILEIRQSLHLSKAQFGEKVGATEAEVEAWENGTAKPGEYRLLKIFQAANGEI